MDDFDAEKADDYRESKDPNLDLRDMIDADRP